MSKKDFDKDFLSIAEFSKFTGINKSTLRYYDEIGLLCPSGRRKNNYRYYTPFQTVVFNFISVLTELGVPRAAIRDMAENRTPESVMELLKHREADLDSQLRRIQASYSVIHSLRNNIQEGLLAESGSIRIKEQDATHLVLGPLNDFTGQDTFYKAFMSFCNLAGDYRINLKYPVGGYHENMKAFSEAPGRPQRFLSFDPYGNTEREKGLYLIGYTQGYYGEVGDLPVRMEKYAEEHSLAFTGPVYTAYLLDEISVTDSDQYLASFSVAVSEKKTQI